MRNLRLVALAVAMLAGSGCQDPRANSTAGDGSPPRQVSDAPTPLTAELAYVQLSGDHWQIWVCDAEKNTHWQLTHDPTDKRCPKWSANGDALFFRNARRVNTKGPAKEPAWRRVE